MRGAPLVSTLALLFVSCKNALVPLTLPEGSRQFFPEPVFRAWWAQMEVCSGMTSSYDLVTWYVVPGEVPFRRIRTSS